MTMGADMPDPAARYESLRRAVGRLRTSNYDISRTCNLRCEGCLFFSGADAADLGEVTDTARWRAFFAAEARRGINFAYLAGAEPSLVPERIAACHDHIAMGVIFTNGTKKISPDIRYRIHVSLWGNETRSILYRGGNANARALRNYAGDPRAVFVLTLSNLNLEEAAEVAQACQDHGVKLTFSLFSPTLDYQARQQDGAAERSDFFRFSSSAQDMRFDREGLARARAVIQDLSQRHPGTVLASQAYYDWITGVGDLYALDANGIATDCGNRLTRWHRHFNADLTRNSGKCCSPNLDCRDCRAYAMGLASYLTRRELRQDEAKWLEVWQFWADVFLMQDSTQACAPLHAPVAAG